MTERTLAAPALTRIVEHCKSFHGASLSRSLGQLAVSLGIFAVFIVAMFWGLASGAWWLTVLLALPAGGMLVKIFIIQHDCGHGSYFKSRTANDITGFFLSILTFTPYGFWRDAHNRHHASSGNLSRRGLGAVDTLTVTEYEALSPAKRRFYRLYRNPFVLLFIGAPVYFLLMQRVPLNGVAPYHTTYVTMPKRRIWWSIVALNLALVVFYGGLMVLLGALDVLLVIAPVVAIAGWIGAALFFVQHQYEDAYWAHQEEWDYTEAALYGSSHFDLPQPFRWMTGNIGLHHIHHLASLIPNYRLQECYDASADLQTMPKLSFKESLRCPQSALWDEARGKMIGFKDLAQHAV